MMTALPAAAASGAAEVSADPATAVAQAGVPAGESATGNFPVKVAETTAPPAEATSGSGRFVLGEELPKPAAAPRGQPADGSKADDGATDDYRPMDWDTLIPADWEPLKDFKALDFSSMSDSDPRAIAALRKLQKAWKNAPLNPAIRDEKIEISGFIVPLDSSDSSTIEELLLVPYFGACIHVPPPPSNQVIHVTLDKPLKGFQMMDPVTVTGVLRPSRTDTPFGSAGYQLSARTVRAYEEAPDEAMPVHP